VIAEAQVDEIKELLKQGEGLNQVQRARQGLSLSAIGKRFGVSKSVIQRIANGSRFVNSEQTCVVCGDIFVVKKPRQSSCGDYYCTEVLTKSKQSKKSAEILAEAQARLAEERRMNQIWNRVFGGLA